MKRQRRKQPRPMSISRRPPLLRRCSRCFLLIPPFRRRARGLPSKPGRQPPRTRTRGEGTCHYRFILLLSPLCWNVNDLGSRSCYDYIASKYSVVYERAHMMKQFHYGRGSVVPQRKTSFGRAILRTGSYAGAWRSSFWGHGKFAGR